MKTVGYRKIKHVFDLFPEIKDKALELLDNDYSATAISKSLGVHPNLIYRWKRSRDLSSFMSKDEKNLEMRDSFVASLKNLEASREEELIPF